MDASTVIFESGEWRFRPKQPRWPDRVFDVLDGLSEEDAALLGFGVLKRCPRPGALVEAFTPSATGPVHFLAVVEGYYAPNMAVTMAAALVPVDPCVLLRSIDPALGNPASIVAPLDRAEHFQPADAEARGTYERWQKRAAKLKADAQADADAKREVVAARKAQIRKAEREGRKLAAKRMKKEQERAFFADAPAV